MIRQPVIDELHQALGVRHFEAESRVPAPESGQLFDELRMSVAVQLCRGAMTSGHALLLQPEMRPGVLIERFEEFTVYAFSPSLVQGEAKILRHLKQHPMMPVDCFDARGVFDGPLQGEILYAASPASGGRVGCAEMSSSFRTRKFSHSRLSHFRSGFS